jgi:hypothetical protein
LIARSRRVRQTEETRYSRYADQRELLRGLIRRVFIRRVERSARISNSHKATTATKYGAGPSKREAAHDMSAVTARLNTRKAIHVFMPDADRDRD